MIQVHGKGRGFAAPRPVRIKKIWFPNLAGVPPIEHPCPKMESGKLRGPVRCLLIPLKNGPSAGAGSRYGRYFEPDTKFRKHSVSEESSPSQLVSAAAVTAPAVGEARQPLPVTLSVRSAP
jgi:hypothetical protein